VPRLVPEVVAVVRQLLAPSSLQVELLVKNHKAALAVALLISQMAAQLKPPFSIIHHIFNTVKGTATIDFR
jgi:hypothetical protein